MADHSQTFYNFITQTNLLFFFRDLELSWLYQADELEDIKHHTLLNFSTLQIFQLFCRLLSYPIFISLVKYYTESLKETFLFHSLVNGKNMTWLVIQLPLEVLLTISVLLKIGLIFKEILSTSSFTLHLLWEVVHYSLVFGLMFQVLLHVMFVAN